MICSYCDQPIFGVPFGGYSLHPGCHEAMEREFDEVFGEDQLQLASENPPSDLSEVLVVVNVPTIKLVLEDVMGLARG